MYTYVKAFTRLLWDADSNHFSACSREDASVNIYAQSREQQAMNQNKISC